MSYVTVRETHFGIKPWKLDPFHFTKKINSAFSWKKFLFLSQNFLPATVMSYQKHGLPRVIESKKTNFGFILFAFINGVRN